MTTATRAASPGSRTRHAPLIWVACGAAGAGLALFASGRTWETVTFGGGPAGSRPAPVPLAGGDLAPFIGPLALAALAAVLAVFATRGLWRRLVGVVIGLFGAGIVVGAARALTAGHAISVARERTTMTGGDMVIVSSAWAWPGAAAAGGVLLVLAGVLAVARGGRWPGMSDRYDRAGSPPEGAGTESTARPQRPGQAERSLWDALDRGVDPTDGRSG
ncbi:MAG: hypothetical protein JWQ95_6223 [Sphaerisporangium sp.]|jgi:uncharacterized membrane protein (TIGR02234 family)|nr:hypothetical protein [Sphaerisporangium sp.]